MAFKGQLFHGRKIRKYKQKKKPRTEVGRHAYYGYNERDKMKNWEQMKDFSYVNIKLTKAKTITEGITRCKIDKLSRKNPVYEHLQLHKLHKQISYCPLCHCSPAPTSQETSPPKYLKGRSQNGSAPPLAKSIPVRLRDRDSSALNEPPIEYQTFFRRILNETPREKARKETERFNHAISCFNQGLRKTRSQFDFVKTKKSTMENYFFTAIDDIELEINEDKGLSIRQIRTDSKAMKEELMEMQRKRQKMDKKVKELSKPVNFPLTERQIGTIVKENLRGSNNSRARLNKMVTSLFQYKSCKNYSKRMKTIASIVNK